MNVRALLFALVCLLLFAAIFASAVAAPPEIVGWQLVEQPFNGAGPVGEPISVSCRADVDYINGVIPARADCLKDGRYLTEEECVRAEGKHKIILVNEGTPRWAGAVLLCYHEGKK